jgi:hypothetical protein
MDEQDMGEFVAFAVPYLRAQFPAVGSSAELPQRVRTSVERALEYGFETEEQLLDFATASCLLGANFEVDPENQWAADVLNDEEASLDERAALLSAIASTLVEEREGE